MLLAQRSPATPNATQEAVASVSGAVIAEASEDDRPGEATQQAVARLVAAVEAQAADEDDGPGSFSQLPVGSLPSSFVGFLNESRSNDGDDSNFAESDGIADNADGDDDDGGFDAGYDADGDYVHGDEGDVDNDLSCGEVDDDPLPATSLTSGVFDIDDGNKVQLIEELADWDSGDEDGFEEVDQDIDVDPLRRAELYEDSDDDEDQPLVDDAFL